MKTLAAIVMCWSVCLVTADATVSFFDGDFDPADWNSIMQTGNGSFLTETVPAGGNPGGFMRVDHKNFTGDIQVFHFFNEAVYDPAVGPVQQILWSLDEKAIQNLYGIGVAVSLAIEQDGIRYAAFPAGLNNSSSWVTFTHPDDGFVAAHFWDFPNGFDYPYNPGHPDFSSNGSPMRFGFCTHNNNTDVLASRAAGFDNWSVSIITVPEPATLLFLGLGASLLRRRK